jgi:diketogulonate reductase-like aldo/keto reductase
MPAPASSGTRPFGATGVQLPAIGFGTWYLEEADPAQALRAVRAALDLGLTHIDTAELYGSGRVETLVGEAIEARRDEVFLVSKIIPSHASRRATIATCEKSLQRLRTDHLDCYLLHWPGPHPLEDTLAAFDELQSAGKIRSWGVSNFDEQGLERVLQIAGPGRIACNQVLYNLEERTIEHAVVPWCQAHDVAVVGYTPFGSSPFPPAGKGGEVLAEIALRVGKTPRQVALSFLTRQADLFAIPKAAQLAHVQENAGAARLHLSAADLLAIDRAFPVGKRRRGVATL